MLEAVFSFCYPIANSVRGEKLRAGGWCRAKGAFSAAMPAPLAWVFFSVRIVHEVRTAAEAAGAAGTEGVEIPGADLRADATIACHKSFAWGNTT